jgi:hypothetical protein
MRVLILCLFALAMANLNVMPRIKGMSGYHTIVTFDCVQMGEYESVSLPANLSVETTEAITSILTLSLSTHLDIQSKRSSWQKVPKCDKHSNPLKIGVSVLKGEVELKGFKTEYEAYKINIDDKGNILIEAPYHLGITRALSTLW